eukprot:c17965_g1_i1 orf=399-806(+)
MKAEAKAYQANNSDILPKGEVRYCECICKSRWVEYMDTNVGKKKTSFWYDPKNKTKRLRNAFDSISSIITKYGLDGIDVDDESLQDKNDLTDTMGHHLRMLEHEGLATCITIARIEEPFRITLTYSKATSIISNM